MTNVDKNKASHSTNASLNAGASFGANAPLNAAAALDSRLNSDLLNRKQAAIYLGVAEQTLAIWKSTNRYNLPVVKIGRLVKYKKADLDAFIESRTLAG